MLCKIGQCQKWTMSKISCRPFLLKIGHFRFLTLTTYDHCFSQGSTHRLVLESVGTTWLDIFRVNGLRRGWTSAQEHRHKFWKISSTSAHVIILHFAEVNIPMKLGVKVDIWCRSPQVGAELIPCRSYSCRTSIAPHFSDFIGCGARFWRFHGPGVVRVFFVRTAPGFSEINTKTN